MKELLEQLYLEGCNHEIFWEEDFEQWYEQNQVNIDNAIELYLNLQGKSIVKTSTLDYYESLNQNRTG